MSAIRKMILSIEKIDSIRTIILDEDSSEGFFLEAKTGMLRSIKMISDSVLEISFENCKLLLDFNKKELKNIKYEE
ncbi:MAG: hypothetical protein ACTSVE_14970 [Candidatus Helarchaeota archaeon]